MDEREWRERLLAEQFAPTLHGKDPLRAAELGPTAVWLREQKRRKEVADDDPSRTERIADVVSITDANVWLGRIQARRPGNGIGLSS